MEPALVVAATLFLQAVSEEAGLDGWSRPRSALVLDYQAACTAGVKLACEGVAERVDLASLQGAATDACGHLDAAACVVAGWAEAGGRRSGAERTFVVPQLELGCTLGLPRACSELVRMTARRGDEEPAATANLARSQAACAAGDALGCEMEALLEWWSKGDRATAVERARSACDRGRADACVIAARLAQRLDGAVDPVEFAACEVGVVAACLDLPIVPYDPAQVLAWCRAGASDACRRVRPDLPWIGLLLAGGADWARTAVDEGGRAELLAPYEDACGRHDLLACTVRGDVLVHQGSHQEGLTLLADTCRRGELAACRRVVGSLEVGYGVPRSPTEAARIRTLIAEDDADAEAEPSYDVATAFGVPGRSSWRPSSGVIHVLTQAKPAMPTFLPPGEWRCVVRIQVTAAGMAGALYFTDCEPYFYAPTYRATRDLRFTPTEEGGWYDLRVVYRMH